MCARWGLPPEAFAESLRRSAEKRFGCAPSDPSEVETYLESLHLEDLALACACSEGIERPGSFSSFISARICAMPQAPCFGDRAEPMTPAPRNWRILFMRNCMVFVPARTAGGNPCSNISMGAANCPHGFAPCSRKNKWTCFERAAERFLSMPKWKAMCRANSPVASNLSAPILIPIARGILGGSKGRSPRRLPAWRRGAHDPPCYYVDQLTLAEIGRMLREHESTVSRQLERMRRALREGVTQALRRETPARNGRPPEPALDTAQVELAFEYAVEDWPFDLSQALSASGPVVDPSEE